jgi:hypothetical protein
MEMVIRRAAFYKLFMVELHDPLFALLAALIGLNLQTGKYYEMGEFDPKHLCERRLLCRFALPFSYWICFRTVLQLILGMLAN